MTAIPLIYSFWLMLTFYVIHILDEALLGGSFVDKVKEHWWPKYSWQKFFWFNAGYIFIMGASIVSYDQGGTSFLFLPIAWAVERLANSFWHVWWAARFHEYSPGLLTSVLIWIQTYFIFLCRPHDQALDRGTILPALLLGFGASAFISLYIPIVKGRNNRSLGSNEEE